MPSKKTSFKYLKHFSFNCLMSLPYGISLQLKEPNQSIVPKESKTVLFLNYCRKHNLYNHIQTSTKLHTSPIQEISGHYAIKCTPKSKQFRTSVEIVAQPNLSGQLSIETQKTQSCSSNCVIDQTNRFNTSSSIKFATSYFNDLSTCFVFPFLSIMTTEL